MLSIVFKVAGAKLASAYRLCGGGGVPIVFRSVTRAAPSA